MKIITYKYSEKVELGLLVGSKVYSLSNGDDPIGNNMLEFLQSGEKGMERARELEASIIDKAIDIPFNTLDTVELKAPIPNPTSCRDAYAFRQHVATARRNRGVDMIPEFDQYPIFYFTNHNAMAGPSDDIECMEDHFQKLDYELEMAIVIGKKGINIKAENADEYIAGYMIMNDMSARTLQMEEMKLNLGPAKGKDFCTVIGPYLVTPDELKDKLVAPPNGHTGNNHDLFMNCWVNGKLLSEGNVSSMDWTFAEIIERCSYGTHILPGDVIGSGTVGTGCLLELNGTGKYENPDYEPWWLKEGDVVEMEIEGLGKIQNTIIKKPGDYSILRAKKNVQPAS